MRSNLNADGHADGVYRDNAGADVSVAHVDVGANAVHRADHPAYVDADDAHHEYVGAHARAAHVHVHARDFQSGASTHRLPSAPQQ